MSPETNLPSMDLPSGTVTFLFTDIQGSTELLKQLGEAYKTLLVAHHNILRAAFPDRASNIPTRTLPAFVVRLLANFNTSLKTLRADLGVVPIADNGYVTELTGVEFRPAADAVRAAGQSLIDQSIV